MLLKKVHLESNSWAICSGLAKGDHAQKALNAIDKYLYSSWGIHLNWPSYGTPDYNGLVVDPCIPESWEGYKVTRIYRGATYNIEVRNPEPLEKGRAITIPFAEPGSVNNIVVTMAK